MKMFDADKTKMIGLHIVKKNYDNILSRFHPIPELNGRTDRRTDRFTISISRVSMPTCNKNTAKNDSQYGGWNFFTLQRGTMSLG